jgi:DNA replication and repair protein RecF
MPDSELVRFGEPRFRLFGEFEDRGIVYEAEMLYGREKGKRIKFNGQILKKTAELIGRLTAVYFSPQDTELILGAPFSRRQFFNILLSQCDNNYFYNLRSYIQKLRQRNALLRGKCAFNRKVLDVLTSELVESGQKLVEQRRIGSQRINEFLCKDFKNFFSDREDLAIRYICSWEETAKCTQASGLIRWYGENLVLEQKKGYTLCGPHHDDFEVNLLGRPLKRFGSQGQIRLAAILLKLSGLNLLEKMKGSFPILLLDDVLSELDMSRGVSLMKLLEPKGQMIFATPEIPAHLPLGDHRLFKVDGGTLKDG